MIEAETVDPQADASTAQKREMPEHSTVSKHSMASTRHQYDHLPIESRLSHLASVRAGCPDGGSATGNPKIWGAVFHGVMSYSKQVMSMMLGIEDAMQAMHQESNAKRVLGHRHHRERRLALKDATSRERGKYLGKFDSKADVTMEAVRPRIGVHLRFGSEIDVLRFGSEIGPLVGAQRALQHVNALPFAIRSLCLKHGWVLPRLGHADSDLDPDRNSLRRAGIGIGSSQREVEPQPAVHIGADRLPLALEAAAAVRNYTGLSVSVVHGHGRNLTSYHVDRSVGDEHRHDVEGRAMLVEWILFSQSDVMIATGSGFARTAMAAGFVSESYDLQYDGGLGPSACHITLGGQSRPAGPPAGY